MRFDTSAAGSYAPRYVKIRPAAPADDGPAPDRPARDLSSDPVPLDAEVVDPAAVAFGGRVDLTGLSIAGITRRRVAWVVASFLAVWIVIVFARQVSEAAAASNRAVQLAADNAALAAEVQSLEAELGMIVQRPFVEIQARGYGLGKPHEIPFTLDPTIPAPVDGAPGSSSVRLGASADRGSPLESWLSLLFGPGD